MLSRLQLETPTPWDSVRHDVYTFRFAMDHLAAARPRALYLALGETDDWAHDGRYDRVLETYARTDAYLRELWTWLQADPEYRDRTHLLITTDHGRGRTTKDWRNHGAKVEGAAGRLDRARLALDVEARRVARSPGAAHESGRGDARRLDGRRLARPTAGGRSPDSPELTPAAPRRRRVAAARRAQHLQEHVAVLVDAGELPRAGP